MPLIANIVGVGALFGEAVFLEEIVRLVLGLPMDRKSGVGPNGEAGSSLEEEDRAARYGRFHCMNLRVLVSNEHGRGRRCVLHVIAELQLPLFLASL